MIKDGYDFKSDENKNFHKLIEWMGDDNLRLFEITIN